ncbi:MAG: RNA methyltransferase [Caldilineaceae bacterium]|nr:RNA methyltransferase [Caldilineaceae bacterium]
MITSLDNPRIKEIRKLQRKRYRYQSGTLLIEGVRLVGDAFQSHAPIRHVYFAPELMADNPPAQQLLAQIVQAQIPQTACSSVVFTALTETVSPQGIAAVTALPALPLPATITLGLVLDQVRDPGNAGTLLRAAEAAGVELVIFGPETVDPFNDKVLRAGMGAHFRLPVRTCSHWAAITSLFPVNFPFYLAQANATQTYDATDWRQPAALIVGGEAAGASVTAAQVAQAIAIPMLGHAESLNAAMAGTAILFEAARQRRQQQSPASTLSPFSILAP